MRGVLDRIIFYGLCMSHGKVCNFASVRKWLPHVWFPFLLSLRPDRAKALARMLGLTPFYINFAYCKYINNMATPHISAALGDFAKTVLMPGDPLRAKFIAETFLENAKLVTSVRNVLGYTGLYKGKPVSVMASGMGMPSIGIYSYELYKLYGVENIIRIGSAGSYRQWLKVMDVTIADVAVSESSYARVQGGCADRSIKPSAELNAAIKAKAGELGIECKPSVVHSSDVFYGDPSQGTWQDIAERTGSDCVEMESFALFHNANMLGKRAACLLTISDSFVDHTELSAEDRQNSFTQMMTLALETAIAL